MLAVSAALAAMITGLGGGAAQADTAVPCKTAALSAAVGSAPSGAVLSLATGCTYVLTAGLPAVTGTLTIAGNGSVLKRSTAPGTPAFTIMTVTGGNLAVSSLSFRNGGGSPSLAGGAISVTGDGQLAVTGGRFTQNSEGAIYSNNGLGIYAPVVTDAVFARNDGGAIGNFSYSASLVITGCTFRDNTGTAVSDFGLGGSINGTFIRNTGDDGGAISVNENNREFISGTFTGNTATNDGGAIYGAEAGGGIAFSGTLRGNHAGGDGGGIWNG